MKKSPSKLFIILAIVFLFIPLTRIFGEAKTAKVHIVFLGDSLTEGYGIEKDLAYPNLIEKRLKINPPKGADLKIYNAGISGSTSASSLSRFKWFIKNQPTHLFLSLGANDGLRGVLPAVTKKHLKDTIKLAKENGIKVMLAGMKMPPNYGEKYSKEFEAVFAQVASEEKIPFMPFLLEKVATNESLNQTDGIHPNEKGHAVIAENVYQFLIKNIPELKP